MSKSKKNGVMAFLGTLAICAAFVFTGIMLTVTCLRTIREDKAFSATAESATAEVVSCTQYIKKDNDGTEDIRYEIYGNVTLDGTYFENIFLADTSQYKNEGDTMTVYYTPGDTDSIRLTDGTDHDYEYKAVAAGIAITAVALVAGIILVVKRKAFIGGNKDTVDTSAPHITREDLTTEALKDLRDATGVDISDETVGKTVNVLSLSSYLRRGIGILVGLCTIEIPTAILFLKAADKQQYDLIEWGLSLIPVILLASTARLFGLAVSNLAGAFVEYRELKNDYTNTHKILDVISIVSAVITSCILIAAGVITTLQTTAAMQAESWDAETVKVLKTVLGIGIALIAYAVLRLVFFFVKRHRTTNAE